MKNSLKLALIGLLFIAPAVIHPARVRAAQAAPQAVTYTRLKGTYSFLAPSYYEYYYGQGTFTFDGNGNVTGVMNFNYDDTICTGMLLAGTYTVNPGLASGSAQISVTAGCGAGDTMNLELAIGSAGNTIYFAEMDEYVSGYFSDDFYPFGGTASHY